MRCQLPGAGQGSLKKVQLRTVWKPLTSLDKSQPLAQPEPSCLDPAWKDAAAVQPDCPGPGDEGLGAEGVTQGRAGRAPDGATRAVRDGAKLAGLAFTLS